jgi:hypothetical protein
MPRVLTWGRSIDVVEISPATTRGLGRPRVWEVRTKAGGSSMGSVYWFSKRRAYMFVPNIRSVALDARTLLDVGQFCKNRTQAMLDEKRKAAG